MVYTVKCQSTIGGVYSSVSPNLLKVDSIEYYYRAVEYTI